MSKRILITGGMGQLGFSLYLKLKELFDVYNTSKKETHKFNQLDVASSDQVQKILDELNPDVIINCASYNNVDQSELNKKEARECIVEGVKHLIKYSEKNCSIIQISSDYIYDGKQKQYSEEDKPNPINYYGKLKHEAENLLTSSRRKVSILRANVVFSHYINNKSNFFAWVYNNLKNNKEIKVVDDQISNPCPVHLMCDIVEAVILLDRYSIYNIGTLDSLNRFEFSLKIAKIFGFNPKLIKSIKTKDLKQVANRPLNTFLNFKKAKEELGVDFFSIDYYLEKFKGKIDV